MARAGSARPAGRPGRPPSSVAGRERRSGARGGRDCLGQGFRDPHQAALEGPGHPLERARPAPRGRGVDDEPGDAESGRARSRPEHRRVEPSAVTVRDSAPVLMPVIGARVANLTGRVLMAVGLFLAGRVLVIVHMLVRVRMAVAGPVGVRMLMLVRVLMGMRMHGHLLPGTWEERGRGASPVRDPRQRRSRAR